MSVINYLDSDTKLQYKDIVCTDSDTSFLNKYLELPDLKRLDGIGQFCGCDHTNIHNSIIAPFTSLDHSYITAKMVYHFTGDKKQAVAALFHDILTASFKHANDFRIGDTSKQESSETNKYGTFKLSKALFEYLKEDGLTFEDIIDVKMYPILENKKPRLCTDRLDGVIHTNLIWRPYWKINDVENIYNNITILINEENKKELGFKDTEIALKFADGIYRYAIALQLNETNYTLQFVGDIIKTLIDEKLITEADLYRLSEDDITKIISNSRLSVVWENFNNSNEIIRCNSWSKKLNDIYVYSSKNVKKRYVDPLCLYNSNAYRLSEISYEWKQKIEEYLKFKDSNYCYVKGLKQFR